MKGDKMKKLLIVLLVVALAAFLLVGCIPGTPPPDDDGGGDGETEVGVVIEDVVVIDSKTYVSAGDHTITVTFPAPVAGVVTANITECTGDYSKQEDAVGTSVVLFPDATKKIWTGSGTFLESAECCASYIEVTSGECADVVCIMFPVIVDGEPPYAEIDIKVANCDCPGCEITFTSTAPTIPCEGTELCCDDDCSGLASWSIDIYDEDPFDECCLVPCAEPVESGSGVCPIVFTTDCLVAGTYYAVVNLVDNVGLEQNYYAKIVVTGGATTSDPCRIVVTEGFEAPAPYCVTWATNPTATIGACTSIGPQPGDDYVPPDDGDDNGVNDGPDAVNLRTASYFVILSKSGITNTGSHTSDITGNIGSSPITAAAMSNVFCTEIDGIIYGVDHAYVGSGDETCFAGNPPESNKTLVDNAVLDMEAAYTDAAGRTNPTVTELDGGIIGGRTLAPGLYKWSTDVIISTDVTLSGGAEDVWIFQIAGKLSIASGGNLTDGIKIILAGGALASNVFWQVGGSPGATLGTYSTFNGTILSKEQIIIQTGAVLNGRAWAQTQVTLDASTVGP
jgi:hypothetical protein